MQLLYSGNSSNKAHISLIELHFLKNVQVTVCVINIFIWIKLVLWSCNFKNPFFFQSFIRSCLAYRKEDRIDVLSLARHEYLQPPMPKHSRLTSNQQQQQQQAQQQQQQSGSFSTGIFGAMNASSSS